MKKITTSSTVTVDPKLMRAYLKGRITLIFWNFAQGDPKENIPNKLGTIDFKTESGPNIMTIDGVAQKDFVSLAEDLGMEKVSDGTYFCDFTGL